MTNKTITAAIIVLAALFMVGTASATDQITVNPDTTLDIDVGTVGHYTLTLTTNIDPIDGRLYWESDDSLIWANIGDAPVDIYGDMTITTSSTCSGTGKSQVCTQTFDLQVEPQSGITLNEQHDVTVTYENINGVAKAMATAGTIPTPEVATVILVASGLIGLVVLRRRT